MTHTSNNRVNNKSTKQHATKSVNPTGKMTFNVCTDTIQNDSGANRAVTSNQSILVSYEDISPFPIRGVYTDNITIIYTGRGLLPWMPNQGTCTMIETLYCAEVYITTISPIIVVRQHKELYLGFTIEANVDKGTGD